MLEPNDPERVRCCGSPVSSTLTSVNHPPATKEQPEIAETRHFITSRHYVIESTSSQCLLHLTKCRVLRDYNKQCLGYSGMPKGPLFFTLFFDQ